MKKIYNILLLALAAAFTSCTGLVDDIFDTSSANRAAETMEANREVLLSAPNGWRLTMKADPDDEFGIGAYNILLKFNADNTVNVSTDMAEADSVITSHFKLYQSQGINLSFDEHNAFIHYFSDPVNPDGFGQAGKGLKGDFEFIILKATKDEVILKGKKSSVKMKMVPVQAGNTWKDEIEYIKTVESEMCEFNTYNIELSDTTVRVSRTYRSYTYYDKEGNKFIFPFNVTKSGIEFLEPAEIKGHKITGFEYDANSGTYTALGDKSTTISPVVLPPTQLFANGTYWFFAKSLMSESAAELFNDGVMNIADNFGVDVVYSCFYYDAKEKYLTNYLSCSPYAGNIMFNYEIIDDETVKISYLKADGNGSYFYNYGFTGLVNKLKGTFKLIPDDKIKTKKMTFVSTTDENFYFTLTVNEVEYPNTK